MSALNELQYNTVAAQKALTPDQKDLASLERKDQTQGLEGGSEGEEAPVSTSRFITCVSITDSD